jgi:hypothetical protein
LRSRPDTVQKEQREGRLFGAPKKTKKSFRLLINGAGITTEATRDEKSRYIPPSKEDLHIYKLAKVKKMS